MFQCVIVYVITWTLKTPHGDEPVTSLACWKRASVLLRSPWRRVTFGDRLASLWAEGEVLSRVTARSLKSAFLERRARMAAPPCLPVAPVMRRERDMVYMYQAE